MNQPVARLRLSLMTLATLAAAPVFAAPPATDLQSASAFSAPAADKVYPPLPSLAMLPPSSGDDDLPVKPSPRRKKSRAPVRVEDHHAAPAPTPTIRLIVSDASHAYLDSVQRQIDLALAR